MENYQELKNHHKNIKLLKLINRDNKYLSKHIIINKISLINQIMKLWTIIKESNNKLQSNSILNQRPYTHHINIQTEINLKLINRLWQDNKWKNKYHKLFNNPKSIEIQFKIHKKDKLVKLKEDQYLKISKKIIIIIFKI